MPGSTNYLALTTSSDGRSELTPVTGNISIVLGSNIAPYLPKTVFRGHSPNLSQRSSTDAVVIAPVSAESVGLGSSPDAVSPSLHLGARGDPAKGDAAAAGGPPAASRGGSVDSSCHSSRSFTSSSGGTAHCAICLEAIQVGDTVCPLECKHTFHFDCTVTWLSSQLSQRQAGKCPMCNLVVIVPVFEERSYPALQASVSAHNAALARAADEQTARRRGSLHRALRFISNFCGNVGRMIQEHEATLPPYDASPLSSVHAQWEAQRTQAAAGRRAAAAAAAAAGGGGSADTSRSSVSSSRAAFTQ